MHKTPRFRRLIPLTLGSSLAHFEVQPLPYYTHRLVILARSQPFTCTVSRRLPSNRPGPTHLEVRLRPRPQRPSTTSSKFPLTLGSGGNSRHRPAPLTLGFGPSPYTPHCSLCGTSPPRRRTSPAHLEVRKPFGASPIPAHFGVRPYFARIPHPCSLRGTGHSPWGTAPLTLRYGTAHLGVRIFCWISSQLSDC